MIQPLLDVISFWVLRLEMPGVITLFLRIAVLGIASLWGFTIANRKWIYLTLVGVVGLMYAGHVLSCMQVGFADPVSDLANYIRVIQMPIFVLVFSTCLKQNKKTLAWILKGALGALGIIALVEFLSVLTATDPHVYGDKGILGWFSNTNSQSAILSMVIPFALLWTLRMRAEKKFIRPLFFAGVAFLGNLLLFLFGTRLAYLAIFGIAIGFFVVVMLVQRKFWRYGVAILGISLVFAALYPVSVMYTHQQEYQKVQSERQESVDQQIKDELGTSLEDAEEVDPEKIKQALSSIYMTYAKDFVEIFGLEETMRMYNYTADTFRFSDMRGKKIMFANKLMENSPTSARLFGVEYTRFTRNGIIYDVENDLHGIYFLYGFAGLGLYILFVLYFFGLIVWALWKNAKKYFTLEAGASGIALILCLLHVFFTAGVLRRPNASVYLSLILALIYFFVRDRKDAEEIKACDITTHLA
ncbi:MAG: O-antigen ligase family protein [Clostridia bacterium]|nr:O-antigen ligase family protein [Clostridia bacterium]